MNLNLIHAYDAKHKLLVPAGETVQTLLIREAVHSNPLEAAMDSTKKHSAKCSNDAFHRCSSILSFISILLIVALFLRMETINRNTKRNELRISDVEAHLKIAVLRKRAGNEGKLSKGK